MRFIDKYPQWKYFGFAGPIEANGIRTIDETPTALTMTNWFRPIISAVDSVVGWITNTASGTVYIRTVSTIQSQSHATGYIYYIGY